MESLAEDEGCVVVRRARKRGSLRRAFVLLAVVTGAVATALFDGLASAALLDPGDPSSQKRRPPSRDFTWALSLADDKPEGYIAMRRMQLAGTGVDWSRVGRGVYFARELAEMEWERRQDKSIYGDLPRLDGASLEAAIQREARRTAQNVARWGVERAPTPSQRYGGEIRQVIEDVKYARQTLFGSIGDAAIRARLRRVSEQMGAEPRYCAVSTCSNRLPPTARATRTMCDSCRSGNR